MRLFIPLFLLLASILWFLYTGIVKKNWKMAMEILRPTLFFGAVWAIIYYCIFNYSATTTNSRVAFSSENTAIVDTARKQNIYINSGEKFLWKSGLCLKAFEESTFLILGAIFPPGTPIGKILQLSDENTLIQWLSDPHKSGNSLPDFKITLKKGSTLKINRNTEVILTKDSNANTVNKMFTVEEGSLETAPKLETNLR